MEDTRDIFILTSPRAFRSHHGDLRITDDKLEFVDNTNSTSTTVWKNEIKEVKISRAVTIKTANKSIVFSFVNWPIFACIRIVTLVTLIASFAIALTILPFRPACYTALGITCTVAAFALKFQMTQEETDFLMTLAAQNHAQITTPGQDEARNAPRTYKLIYRWVMGILLAGACGVNIYCDIQPSWNAPTDFKVTLGVLSLMGLLFMHFLLRYSMKKALVVVNADAEAEAEYVKDFAEKHVA